MEPGSYTLRPTRWMTKIIRKTAFEKLIYCIICCLICYLYCGYCSCFATIGGRNDSLFSLRVSLLNYRRASSFFSNFVSSFW
jgi:hypothetical protein